MLDLGFQGLKDYLIHFLPRSTHIGSPIESSWRNAWTVFYFANWFAWAPIASMFLGRLAVGYTARDFIHFNLIFPSLFTILWMTVFSGTAIEVNLENNNLLYDIMQDKGEGIVLFEMLKNISGGQVISVVVLVMIFISYVTAADSTISAMSAMSSKGINPEKAEAPIWIKIAWGILIGLIAFIMITSAGVEGIKLLCVLGGFPALFVILMVGFGLLKMVFFQKNSK